MKKKVPLHSATDWLNTFVEPKKKETHIIGLGGAGCNIAKYLYEKGFKGTYSCLSNVERTDLPASVLFIEHHIYSKEKHLQLILNRVKGDKEVPKPDLDTTIPELIEKRLKDNCRFILLVGLGGMTGSYLVKQVADYLKDKDKEFAVVCTTPFNFEGDTNEYADKIKDELAVLPNFYCFSNESIREKYGNMAMRKAFAMADEEVWKICKELFKE